MGKIGAWGGVVLAPLGVGMLHAATGGRSKTSQQWAREAGVDLWTWCALGTIFLVGGLSLIAIVRWFDRK